MKKAPAPANRLTRPRRPMPVFVKEALDKARLMDRYRKRPPYQRNDYLWWINSAKLEATKLKRLTQMLAELKSGDAYMRMAWRAPNSPPRRLPRASSSRSAGRR